MNKKLKRKIKRIFNIYNLAILVCIAIILGSIYVIFKPNITIKKDKEEAKTSQQQSSAKSEEKEENTQNDKKEENTVKEEQNNDMKTKQNENVEIVKTNVKEDEEITEEDAKKAAVKQFKELGEKNVKEDKVNVTKIIRAEEEYYYITSKENSVEVKIKGGKITRINTALVEE